MTFEHGRSPDALRRRAGAGKRTGARARANQVRTVVSVVGAGKNSRSMRVEIEATAISVKSEHSSPFIWGGARVSAGGGVMRNATDAHDPSDGEDAAISP